MRSAKKKWLAAACLPCLLLFGLWVWTGLAPCPHPLAGKDFSTIILDRNGELLRVSLTKDQKYRIRTSPADIPKRALDAIVEYEDRWFWRHPGVNPLAMFRACASMLAGGRRMGGSTITMQVARIAFGLGTTSVWGKIRQIFLALCLERHYSKAEILEAYFSLAPYGGNVEGLAAAALVYFHKKPEQLSDGECEALMLVPQNPVARRPSANNQKFLAAVRRQWGEEERAPLRLFSQASLPFLAPHVCDDLLASLDKPEQARPDSALAKKDSLTPGKTENERRKQTEDEQSGKEPVRQGQVIRSTISLARQRQLENALARFGARNRRLGLGNAAALLLHWPSMEIMALAGSSNFFDPAIGGQIDGTRTRRSPGSTLKPFIYALALEQGLIHPATILPDTPRSFAGYDPENFDRSFRGPVPAAEALRASRNIPALGLASRIGLDKLHAFLLRAGVRLEKDHSHYGLALVLGGAEVTMRELAALYAMLANGGVWSQARLTAGHGQAGTAVLSPEAAFVTLDMLTDDDQEHRVRSRSGAILPLRFKTGTSNGFRDAWTAGIVGNYVLVVWVGNFDNSANPLLVGGQVAAPLFIDLARQIAASENMGDSLEMPGNGLNLEKLPVCTATGDLDTSLCSEYVQTWYIPGVSPLKDSGILRRIHVDRKTGLRACQPESGRTEEVVCEFWPSELAAMFAMAGQPKQAPPPFEPQCAQMAEDLAGTGGQAFFVPGKAPRIQQPRAGLTYHASLAAGGKARIALMAWADADSGQLAWFVNGQPAGTARPGEVLTWQSGPADLEILVSDEHGRTARRLVRVLAAP